MILLWGLPQDSAMAAVRAVLERLNQPIFFLDQRMVLRSAVELTVGTRVTGQLRFGDTCIELDEVHAAYLRPYDTRRLRDIARPGPGSSAWCYALAFDDTMWSWADIAPARVVNRPSAMASNSSKPYQANLIREHGFATPETLITTDPGAARDFWAQHETVVYKSISSVRSIVSRLRSCHTDRIDQVVWCPTQFQRYVSGVDVRVHVVGDELFCREVICDADDYRYASRQGAAVTMRTAALPPDCAAQCRALTVAMGLTVAGIDLRRTHEGMWYCFEVNPSPAFTYYDDQPEQRIARAVAELLAAATSD